MGNQKSPTPPEGYECHCHQAVCLFNAKGIEHSLRLAFTIHKEPRTTVFGRMWMWPSLGSRRVARGSPVVPVGSSGREVAIQVMRERRFTRSTETETATSTLLCYDARM